MNEKPEDNKSLDLSALDFGPSWARGGESKPKRNFSEGDSRKSDTRRPQKGKGRPAHGERRDNRGGGDRRDSRGGRRDDRRGGGRSQRPAPTPAPAGVSADIMPIEAGVDNMAKEIAATGRTYSVFELAYVVLGGRERFHIAFKKPEAEKDLFQSAKDEAVFLTKAECLAHFHQAEWRKDLYLEEEVDCEAPAGNFQAISKCGISGELFGPPNYHAYQLNVAEMHRTRFGHMDLERYKSNIVTERSEEAVEAWRESMKKKVQWSAVGEEGVVLGDRAELEKHFVEKHFESVFRATHRANVPSGVPGKMLSPGLLTLLKETIADQRRYPGNLASFLCRQLSGRNLAVFKWRGKLHCGPSRPHVLAADTKIADRPQAMLEWMKENPGGGIDELWKSVFPDEIEEDQKKEWYHDLHWLLSQGFAVLMSDGHLYGADQSKGKPKKRTTKKSDSSVEKVEAAVAEATVEPTVETVKQDSSVKVPVEKVEEVVVDASVEKSEEISAKSTESEKTGEEA